jgi:hypothetical protein
MKKLTRLQILMLMSLAVGSLQIHGKDVRNMDDQDQAVASELLAVLDESITTELLVDLAILKPEIVQEIVKDETNLKPAFGSVRHSINEINEAIDRLSRKEIISELEVAKFAVEIADVQANFEKAIANQGLNHKHNDRHYEQQIKDGVMKAQQGLKNLYDKTQNNLNANAMSDVMKNKRMKNKKHSKKSPKNGERFPA